MKRISLLGILTILILIGEFVCSLPDMSESIREGYNDGMKESQTVLTADGSEQQMENLFQVTVNVTPVKNTQDNPQVIASHQVSQMECYIQPPVSFMLIGLLLIPAVFIALYGMYCLIRLLIRISRKDVFSRKNIWWLRWFTYSYTGFNAVLGVQNLILEQSALRQINIPGYTIDSIAGLGTDWGTLAVMLLLTEIFAVGVKLKEEQDLTI